jgi:hypothetical protein
MSVGGVFQIYQTLGTVVYLAMSADATCRGLRSQRDGPLVMELTQGKGLAISADRTPCIHSACPIFLNWRLLTPRTNH